MGLVYFGTIQGYNLESRAQASSSIESALNIHTSLPEACWCIWGEMNKFIFTGQELFPQTYCLDNKNMLPTNFVELKRIQDVFSTKSTFLVVLLTVVVAAVESLKACCCPQSGNLCSLMSLGFSLFSMFPVDVFIWEAAAISATAQLRRLLVATQLLSRQVYDYFTTPALSKTKTH